MSLEAKLKRSFDGFSLDVSLEAKEELLVLFGPSGAGKSLLLKILSGIVRPDEGFVRVGSKTLFDSDSGVDEPMRKRRIGYLFQDYSLFPHMSVSENIEYGISWLDKKERYSRVSELLALMRLEGLGKRMPHELSGGQKQRVALARTLAISPDVLLLDEPFSALDAQVREKLRGDLLNIHRLYPVTTVLVTHDIEEAFVLGERIAVIDSGRIAQVGTKDDVFYRPLSRTVAKLMGIRNIYSGVVASVDGRGMVIDSPGLGLISARSTGAAPGQNVSFCIRPEEIPVVRPDRDFANRPENVVGCRILSMSNMGSYHLLYLKSNAGEALIKAELPNFVVRKLGLAVNMDIRVLLKKEAVWVMAAPEGVHA